MEKFGLAQPVRRVEDPRLLMGAGSYTDDIALPGMGFGVVLRSPHAAAAIKGIDTRAAKAMQGVYGVFVAADLDADGIGTLPCAVSRITATGCGCAEMCSSSCMPSMRGMRRSVITMPGFQASSVCMPSTPSAAVSVS